MSIARVHDMQVEEAAARASLRSWQQMGRNTLKALYDHRHLPWNLAALSAPRARGDRSWDVEVGECSLQGSREAMEDRHLAINTPGYGVWFVFDGFGGATAAERAKEWCQQALPRLLEGIDSHPKRALEELCAELGNQLSCERSGSTVQGCVLDKRKGLVYTASLGDGGAFLWRQDTQALAPLSCVRDFRRSKEARRASLVYQKIQEQVVKARLGPQATRSTLLWQYDYPDAWILAQGHAQERGIKPSVISQVGRSPEALMTGLVEGRNGLNLARGVGGRDYKEFLSTHPKVSVTEVRVGDVLIVASDGWTDALPQTFQGMGEVLQGGSPQWVAEQLAQQGALTRDNVTVIVIWFR